MKRVIGLTGHSSPNSKGGSVGSGSIGSMSSNSGESNSTLYNPSGSNAARTITISPHRSTSASTTTISPTHATTRKFTPTPSPYWRLTDTEIQLKKEKGLCFKCDGKFNDGHRCPKRELNVFVVQEEEDFSDTLEEEEVRKERRKRLT